MPTKTPESGRPARDGVDLTVVTMVFDAGGSADVNGASAAEGGPGAKGPGANGGGAGPDAAADALLGVLSRYVVVSRGHPGCRNIDLCASVTVPGRYLVVEKWESPTAQRAHFDSDDMVEMARACEGLLDRRPDIDLFEPISAQDLE